MTTATEQFTPAAKSAQVREFSASVRQMQDDLARMSRAERVSQFGFASLEDTALPVFDALGQARMLLGKQTDGAFAVKYLNGDPPPKPTGVTVSSRQLAIFVYWGGKFAGGYDRPTDLARIDIHRSTVSGFTPDGTTIVGTLPATGGGALLGADSQTYYVRLVAVSVARTEQGDGDIASAPTDEVAVLPLPATQLAVGAVGAQQFAADIGFVSRLVIGNINAGHIELEGRAGMTHGLFATDNGLNPTFALDGLTGSVTMRGTLRSADSGERLVWREYSWANDIRAYPSTGANYAQIYARTFTEGGVDYGAFLLSSPKSATGAKQKTYLWVTHNDLQAYRTKEGSGVDSGGILFLNDDGFSVGNRNTAGTQTGALAVNISGSTMSGPNGSRVYCWDKEVWLFATSTNHIDLWRDSVEFRVGASLFSMSTNSGRKPLLSTDTTSCGIEWNTTGIDVYNPATGAYLYIGAVDISKKSARSAKTDIEAPPFDSVAVIRRAPVSMYEYLDDQRDSRGRYRKADKHLGPMADDLPDQLLREMSDGTPGVLLGSQIAVVWDATARHTETLDDQAETLAGHGARLDVLARRLDALEAA